MYIYQCSRGNGESRDWEEGDEGTIGWGEVAGVSTPREGEGEEGLGGLAATTRVLTGSPKLAICFRVKALIGCSVAT